MLTDSTALPIVSSAIPSYPPEMPLDDSSANSPAKESQSNKVDSDQAEEPVIDGTPGGLSAPGFLDIEGEESDLKIEGPQQAQLFETDPPPWELAAEQDVAVASVVFRDAPYGPYDYKIPGDMRDRLEPGMRVHVPLARRKRPTIGWCVETKIGNTSGKTLSEVAEVIGMSRVGARRYVEHLVTTGTALVEPRYGSTGRPQTSSGPVRSTRKPGRGDCDRTQEPRVLSGRRDRLGEPHPVRRRRYGCQGARPRTDGVRLRTVEARRGGGPPRNAHCQP